MHYFEVEKFKSAVKTGKYEVFVAFLRGKKVIAHEHFFDNKEAYFVIFGLGFEFLNPKIVHLGPKIIKIGQEMSILEFSY